MNSEFLLYSYMYMYAAKLSDEALLGGLYVHLIFKPFRIAISEGSHVAVGIWRERLFVCRHFSSLISPFQSLVACWWPLPRSSGHKNLWYRFWKKWRHDWYVGANNNSVLPLLHAEQARILLNWGYGKKEFCLLLHGEQSIKLIVELELESTFNSAHNNIVAPALKWPVHPNYKSVSYSTSFWLFIRVLATFTAETNTYGGTYRVTRVFRKKMSYYLQLKSRIVTLFL